MPYVALKERPVLRESRAFKECRESKDFKDHKDSRAQLVSLVNKDSKALGDQSDIT